MQRLFRFMALIALALLVFVFLVSSAAAAHKSFGWDATGSSHLITGAVVDDNVVVSVSGGLAPNTPYDLSCQYDKGALKHSFIGYTGQTSSSSGQISYTVPVGFVLGGFAAGGNLKCWIRTPGHVIQTPPTILFDGNPALVSGTLTKQ